jgi:hypothetical protein
VASPTPSALVEAKTPARAAALIAAGSHCTTHSRDRAMQAILIRGCSPEDRDYVRRAILEARAANRTWVTVTQRKWQASVSRRPARGRHHDSWAIREGYVRGGSYTDYLSVAQNLGAPTR